jgi:signal transduction histidine kinase/uncharacterized protein YneF (UPF0154 family)
MTTFLIIMSITLALLSMMMAARVSHYAASQQEQALMNAADFSEKTLRYMYELTGAMPSDRDAGENETLLLTTKILNEYARTSSAAVLIVSPEGKLLIGTQGWDDFSVSGNFSLSTLYAYKNGCTYDSLGGAFSDIRLNYVKSMELGANTFFIVLTSPRSYAEGIMTHMYGSILIAVLWMLAASLAAVYLISDKLTAPLRSMQSAANALARGDFSVRVPVSGSSEIVELATAFNSMAEALQNNENKTAGFISDISHDLRTPLTSISGFIDGMLNGSISPEKYTYYLSVVAEETRRLTRLVHSLLEITRMQVADRKPQKSSFDVCEMARIILLSFENKINEKELHVSFDCEKEKMMVLANKDNIYQVIYNLCDNAVKFSHPKGTLSLTIKSAKDHALISLYNTGEGISEEDKPQIFERLFKSDRSRGLDKSGLGLGLYIVKTILDRHEETLTILSEPGKFCEFVFTLRFAPS